MLSANYRSIPPKMPEFKALQQIDFNFVNENLSDKEKHLKKSDCILDIQDELGRRKGKSCDLIFDYTKKIDAQNDQDSFRINNVFFISGKEYQQYKKTISQGYQALQKFFYSAKSRVCIFPDADMPVLEQVKIVSKPELKLENIYQS